MDVSARAALLSALDTVEFPTLGHFLDDGFLSPKIRRMAGTERLLGFASTVSIPDSDAVAVNQAILRLQPGDVLVIALGDHDANAPVGAVTSAAVRATGAAGIIVGGPVTDLDELNQVVDGETVLPIYATGSTCLTTKRHNSGRSTLGGSVMIGGVRIFQGDVVLGDRNGVVTGSAEVFQRVLEEAQRSDAAEPDLLDRIRNGAPLSDVLFLG